MKAKKSPGKRWLGKQLTVTFKGHGAQRWWYYGDGLSLVIERYDPVTGFGSWAAFVEFKDAGVTIKSGMQKTEGEARGHVVRTLRLLRLGLDQFPTTALKRA